MSPYWRILKIEGTINPKYPGSTKGHKVIQKGKNYVIPDYEEKLILPPEIKF